MIYYITKTRKTGGTESEISHYQYYTNLSATEFIIGKAGLWNATKQGDSFYSNNLQRGTLVECEWYKSVNNEYFLKSDPNGTQKDNLLKLPDC